MRQQRPQRFQGGTQEQKKKDVPLLGLLIKK